MYVPYLSSWILSGHSRQVSRSFERNYFNLYLINFLPGAFDDGYRVICINLDFIF